MAEGLLAPKKSVSRVKVECPIVYFEENLIFNQNKEVWAIYEIKSYNYEHLSVEQKIDKLISQTSFLTMLTDKFHILWLPKNHDIHLHHENLKKNRIAGPLRKRSEQVITEMDHYLQRNYSDQSDANNADYKPYIAVYLPKSESTDITDQVGDILTELKKMILHPMRAIENIAGLNDTEIFEHEFQMYRTKERHIYERLSRRMKIKRGNPSTTEWLIKRNFWWGIGEPELRSTQEKPWSPQKKKGKKEGLNSFRYDSRQVLTLTEGEIDTSHPRRVKITQPFEGKDTHAYHAYLSISELPAESEMPGSEWLYTAATLPFQVEMSIKVEVLESVEALKKLGRKKLDIDNQVKNINEAGATVPLELQEKSERAFYLEDELKKGKKPTFITHVTFGLHHTDINTLKGNCKILQDHYRDFGNVQVQLPAGDQWLLFNDFIPGSPRYVSDYIHRIPPEKLASGMIGATQELGDGKGLYIGTTGHLDHPVFFDPAYASSINRSPSITNTGTLGGGKSMLADLLAYQNVIMGGKTLIFDPKGERSNWIDDLPELTGQMQIATLSSDEADMGKLDPFIMLENIEDAKEAAVEILSYLSSTPTNKEEYSYIARAVNTVASQPKRYLAKVIDELFEIGKERPKAKIVAEILDGFKSLSFAKLLFGNGEQKTIRMDYALNILQIQNLKLPAQNKLPENYSLAEKMSVALMFAIARFAHKFIYHDDSIFKFCLLDEAWALLGTPAGKALADMIVRTGRSLKGGAIIVTQNPTDVSGDLAGNIGMKFAFRDQDTKKIKTTLEYFGLETTQENIDIIKNLESGQCLMQDIHGRVGVLQVDVVFQHLFDCFDTRPPEQSNYQEPTTAEYEEDHFDVLSQFADYLDQEAELNVEEEDSNERETVLTGSNSNK